MATALVPSKAGLKLDFAVNTRPTPRLNQAFPFPEIPVAQASMLDLSLEPVAQTGRTGIRVVSRGASLPGGATAVWSLLHSVTQGDTQASEEIPVRGVVAVNVLLDQPIPDAVHSFVLRRNEAGQVTLFPTATISTPADTTLDELASAKARLDAIGSDGVISDDERPDLRVLRASLSAQVVAAQAKADAMVPAMTYAALAAAWAAFTTNVTPVIDGSGNTAINTVNWAAWWSSVASELVALAGAMANRAQATGTSAKSAADAAALVLTNIADDGQLTDQERPGGVASLSALKGQWQAAWTQAVTRGVSAAILADMRDVVWKPSYSTIAATLYAIPSATNFDSYGSVVTGARLTGTAALPAGYLTYLGGLHNVIIDLLAKTAAVPASAANPGVVKVGAGLSVDGNGVLSATATALPIATTTVLGGIKGSASISIDPVTGIATANVGSGGGWTPGTALTATTGAFSGFVSTNGNIVLNAATSMITSWSRFGSATAGNILFNSGSGSNLVLAETATNVYTIGNAVQGAIPTNVLSINTSNGNISIGDGTLTAQAISATTGTFSGTVTAPASVIDHASEANIILKKGGAYAAGLYNSGTNIGLWDWANSRAIFQHNLAGNVSTFTPPVAFAGGITGNTTINSTGAILTLNNPLGGSSNNEIYFNGAGVGKYRIGSNITIGGYGAFEVYDHANSKLLASFAAGWGGLTLPGTNATNQITLVGSTAGSSSQRAGIKFSDVGYNNLNFDTAYSSGLNTITFTPGSNLALTLSGTGSAQVANRLIVGSYDAGSRLSVDMSGGQAAIFRSVGGTNNPGLWISATEATRTMRLQASGSTSGVLALGTDSGDVLTMTGLNSVFGGAVQAPGNFYSSKNVADSASFILNNPSQLIGLGNWKAGYSKIAQCTSSGVWDSGYPTTELVLGYNNYLVYHSGNVEQSAAALMAVQAKLYVPQWVGSLPSLPNTQYPQGIWNASTGQYDGGMVCVISTKAMYQNQGGAWVSVGAGRGIFGQLVAGQAAIASINASALEADLVMSTIIRTSGAAKSTPGTRHPTGVYISGPPMTTYYEDGTSDANCHIEIEASANIGGCKAAVISNRILGNVRSWTPGTYSGITFPEGVTQVTLQGCGGGAGGQAGSTGAGIGGCAAAFVQGLMTVYPGVPYTVTVGSGGSAGASGGATTISWSGTDLGGTARNGSFTIPGGNLTTGGAATSVQNSGIVFPGLNTSQGHTQRMGQSIWGFLAGGAGGGLFSDSGGAENGGGCDFMIGGSAGAGFSTKGTGGGGGGSSPLGRGGNGGSWSSPSATAGGIGAGGGGGGYTSFGNVAGAGGAGGPGQLKIWW